ncbi:MAG: hypothetical protein JO362_16155, partial [Streptomycetaceae bacterium]|nr:hypothetical protein [Streptomycetaceae bacterium]
MLQIADDGGVRVVRQGQGGEPTRILFERPGTQDGHVAWLEGEHASTGEVRSMPLTGGAGSGHETLLGELRVIERPRPQGREFTLEGSAAAQERFRLGRVPEGMAHDERVAFTLVDQGTGARFHYHLGAGSDARLVSREVSLPLGHPDLGEMIREHLTPQEIELGHGMNLGELAAENPDVAFLRVEAAGGHAVEVVDLNGVQVAALHAELLGDGRIALTRTAGEEGAPTRIVIDAHNGRVLEVERPEPVSSADGEISEHALSDEEEDPQIAAAFQRLHSMQESQSGRMSLTDEQLMRWESRNDLKLTPRQRKSMKLLGQEGEQREKQRWPELPEQLDQIAEESGVPVADLQAHADLVAHSEPTGPTEIRQAGTHEESVTAMDAVPQPHLAEGGHEGALLVPGLERYRIQVAAVEPGEEVLGRAELVDAVTGQVVADREVFLREDGGFVVTDSADNRWNLAADRSGESHDIRLPGSAQYVRFDLRGGELPSVVDEGALHLEYLREGSGALAEVVVRQRGEGFAFTWRLAPNGDLREAEVPVARGAAEQLPEGLVVRIRQVPQGRVVELVDAPGGAEGLVVAPLEGEWALRLPGGFSLADPATGMRWVADGEARVVTQLRPADRTLALTGSEGRDALEFNALPSLQHAEEDFKAILHQARLQGLVDGEVRIGSGEVADLSGSVSFEGLRHLIDTLDEAHVSLAPVGPLRVESLLPEAVIPLREHGLEAVVSHTARASALEAFTQQARQALDAHLVAHAPGEIGVVEHGSFTIEAVVQGGGWRVFDAASEFGVQFDAALNVVAHDFLLHELPQELMGLRVVVSHAAEGDLYHLAGSEVLLRQFRVAPTDSQLADSLRAELQIVDSGSGDRYHFTSVGTLAVIDRRLEASLGYLRLDAREVGGAPTLLDARGVPVVEGGLRLEHLGGDRSVLVPELPSAERPLEGRRVVDSRTGRVVEEIVGVPGERVEYWAIRHESGTAVRLDAEGNPLAGVDATAVVKARLDGGLSLVSSSDSGHVLFQHPDPLESARVRNAEYEKVFTEARDALREYLRSGAEGPRELAAHTVFPHGDGGGFEVWHAESRLTTAFDQQGRWISREYWLENPPPALSQLKAVVGRTFEGEREVLSFRLGGRPDAMVRFDVKTIEESPIGAADAAVGRFVAEDAWRGHRYFFTADGVNTVRDIRLRGDWGYLRTDLREPGRPLQIVDHAGKVRTDWQVQSLDEHKVALSRTARSTAPLEQLVYDVRDGHLMTETVALPKTRGKLTYARITHVVDDPTIPEREIIALLNNAPVLDARGNELAGQLLRVEGGDGLTLFRDRAFPETEVFRRPALPESTRPEWTTTAARRGAEHSNTIQPDWTPAPLPTPALRPDRPQIAYVVSVGGTVLRVTAPVEEPGLRLESLGYGFGRLNAPAEFARDEQGLRVRLPWPGGGNRFGEYRYDSDGLLFLRDLPLGGRGTEEELRSLRVIERRNPPGNTRQYELAGPLEVKNRFHLEGRPDGFRLTAPATGIRRDYGFGGLLLHRDLPLSGDHHLRLKENGEAELVNASGNQRVDWKATRQKGGNVLIAPVEEREQRPWLLVESSTGKPVEEYVPVLNKEGEFTGGWQVDFARREAVWHDPSGQVMEGQTAKVRLDRDGWHWGLERGGTPLFDNFRLQRNRWDLQHGPFAPRDHQAQAGEQLISHREMTGLLAELPQEQQEQLYRQASGILQSIAGERLVVGTDAESQLLRLRQRMEVGRVAYALHTGGEAAAGEVARAIAAERGGMRLQGGVGGASQRAESSVSGAARAPESQPLVNRVPGLEERPGAIEEEVRADAQPFGHLETSPLHRVLTESLDRFEHLPGVEDRAKQATRAAEAEPVAQSVPHPVAKSLDVALPGTSDSLRVDTAEGGLLGIVGRDGAASGKYYNFTREIDGSLVVKARRGAGDTWNYSSDNVLQRMRLSLRGMGEGDPLSRLRAQFVRGEDGVLRARKLVIPEELKGRYTFGHLEGEWAKRVPEGFSVIDKKTGLQHIFDANAQPVQRNVPLTARKGRPEEVLRLPEDVPQHVSEERMLGLAGGEGVGEEALLRELRVEARPGS